MAGTTVRVIVGAVPFYRPLAAGTAGTDVRQLQDALVALGYLGRSDGTFGTTTDRAVRAWQKANGAAPTGQVALGELIAVPALPSELRLGDEITLGALIAGGEDAVIGRTGSQDFRAVLSTEQAQLIAHDTQFVVSYDDQTWTAIVADSAVDEDGNTVMRLTAPGGGPVCADACARLPGDEVVTLRATALVVPETRGPSVPVAALRTATNGSSYVLLADGQSVTVTSLASAQGLAVVEGLQVGQVVLIGDAPQPKASDSPGAG
ncbi:peptidoglycan-binding domain-containing protein [Cellulomonas soli]